MPGYYKRAPVRAAPVVSDVVVTCDGCARALDEGEKLFCGHCFDKRPKELVEVIKEIPVIQTVEIEKTPALNLNEKTEDLKMNFLWRVALTKAGKVVVSYVVAKLGALELSKVGISVEPAVLTAALLAGIETGRNWLKQKTGWKFL